MHGHHLCGGPHNTHLDLVHLHSYCDTFLLIPVYPSKENPQEISPFNNFPDYVRLFK